MVMVVEVGVLIMIIVVVLMPATMMISVMMISVMMMLVVGPSHLQIFVNVYTIRADRNDTVYT